MQVVLNEPLTQVIFVHDYFQLVFQDEVLNIYNAATLQTGNTTFAQGERGFCDELVALVGSKAETVDAAPDVVLSLRFASGAVLSVQDLSTSASPEAYSFHSAASGMVVG